MVPKGSINAPLLFDLFINDLVFFTQNSYATNNNLFISRDDKDIAKSLLSSDFKIVENWFFENYMVLNPGKCNFMRVGKNASDSELLNLYHHSLENCKEVKIVRIDRNLNFKSHIKNNDTDKKSFTLQTND